MRLAPGVPRLARVRDGRVITGLCGGVASLTGYAPGTVRVVFVLGAVLTLGTLVVAYLALSALVPAAQA